MSQRKKSSRKRGSKKFGSLPVVDLNAFANRIADARRKLGIDPDENRFVPLRDQDAS